MDREMTKNLSVLELLYSLVRFNTQRASLHHQVTTNEKYKTLWESGPELIHSLGWVVTNTWGQECRL